MFKCNICGKEFSTSRGLTNHKNSMVANGDNNHKIPKVVSYCINCGNEIISNGKRNFCTNSCSAKFRVKNGLCNFQSEKFRLDLSNRQKENNVMKRPEIREKLTKGRMVNCLTCNKQIFRSPSNIRNKVFCSRKCLGIYLKQFPEEFWKQKEGSLGEIRNCIICGSEFRCDSFSERKYCSHTCYLNTLSREGNPFWGRHHSERSMNRMLQKRNITVQSKPNQLEIKLKVLLDYLFPNEYKYVGNGDFVLGGKCPDFVNVNGKKKIVELFGNYWHKQGSENSRINHFKKYGFDTLIIWEDELNNDTEKLKESILAFQRR